MYHEKTYKEIKKVWEHPRYDPVKKENDIAVVELKGKFEWQVTVRPACLPATTYVDKYKGPLAVSFKDQP